MIIIKLEGGLGNQMFQFAFGRNLSLIHKTPLKVDSSYLEKPNQSQRSIKIDNFAIKLEKATSKEIGSYNSIFQKILNKIGLKNKKVLEKSNTFDPSILSLNDGYFVGHWNSEKYFKENENIIRNDFKLKKPFGDISKVFIEKINNSQNSISIHIRRGDYISIKKIADKHGVLPISYYEEAMRKIKEKFQDVKFFVFSDDIEWAKENLPKNDEMIFISHPNIPEYEELLLMSLCKHNILANSTFSWWGAWLNQNKEKMVIAPKNWFLDKSINTSDLILSTWTQI